MYTVCFDQIHSPIYLPKLLPALPLRVSIFEFTFGELRYLRTRKVKSTIITEKSYSKSAEENHYTTEKTSIQKSKVCL